MKPLVIIHGWSDYAESFVALADALEEKTNRTVENIWLGNYISLDDDVQMSDLVKGLALAWKDHKLPVKARGADVIVHSTGGLIIRDWMNTYYVAKGEKPPVNNLVMLAPANYGSPLAHKGRAFYGRVLKGFKSRKRFQTGTQILKALEMASPYSWELAQRDRFAKNVFSSAGVRATVIVGNTGYGGISSLANEDGSDGTVYVSTANLDCDYLMIDFPSLPKQPKARPIKASKGASAFLVVDEHNHSSVALKDEDHDGNTTLLRSIVKALNMPNAADFNKWIKSCNTKTRSVMRKYEDDDDEYKHGFQNTVFRVRDDQGFDVTDYVIEFYNDANLGIFDRFAELFNKRVLSKVHTFGDNPAYRSFMINCTELYKLIDEDGESLRISLSAMPDINDDKNMVGYRTFEDNDIGCIELGPKEIKQYFKPNRTLFVDIKLTREQKKELFTIRRVDDVKTEIV
jgi:pimeloyl-ACP methyl ester carboxylesterase